MGPGKRLSEMRFLVNLQASWLLMVEYEDPFRLISEYFSIQTPGDLQKKVRNSFHLLEKGLRVSVPLWRPEWALKQSLETEKIGLKM